MFHNLLKEDTYRTSRLTASHSAEKDRAFQENEKKKSTEELLLANKELAFQTTEKNNRVTELAFQNAEKEKRAAELAIANKELIFQNGEKENRAAELSIANKELAFQNGEKEKRASELTVSNKKLRKTEEALKQYIRGLEKMMFMTSHRVRQPIAQIIGIADILENTSNSPAQIKEMIGYMKKSALLLDIFTKDLTVFMSKLKGKGKRNISKKDSETES